MPLTADSKDISLNTALIIGAGLAGSFAALEVAKKHKVILIEQGKEVVPEVSSSFNECYKLHTGLHYAGDEPTAIKCLEESVAFAREIPSNCLAGDQKLDSPWRRGRHFVMSNSLFSVDQVKLVAKALQKKYTELVDHDPKNKVFGEPDNFIKFLDKKEYAYIAEKIPFTDMHGHKPKEIKVVLGIETAESQIDIEKLRQYLAAEIAANKNIEFVPNTQVINLAPSIHRLGYDVTIRNQQGIQTLYTPSIINCAWQNIEKLEKQLGLYVPDENRVIRVKVCTRVELPPSMRHINTCIFSIGPYCSFTNLGNGEAVLASEITTNVGFYKAGAEIIPPLLAKITRQPLDPTAGIGQFYAEKIKEECAAYLPGLKDAKTKRIMVGHVKLMNITKKYDEASLFDEKSSIHQRMESGIEVRDLCFLSDSGNKMTFAKKNGIDIAKKLDEHFLIRDQLNELLQSVEKPLAQALRKMGRNYPIITHTLLYNTCKRAIFHDAKFHASTYKQEHVNYIVSSIIKTLQQKEAILTLVRRGFLKNNLKPEQQDTAASSPPVPLIRSRL